MEWLVGHNTSVLGSLHVYLESFLCKMCVYGYMYTSYCEPIHCDEVVDFDT